MNAPPIRHSRAETMTIRRGPVRSLLLLAFLLLVAGGGWFAWQALRPAGLPPGFAQGNGRIEAVEIDVATKIAGRVSDILVNEGDFVTAGQIVARMDTAVLEAQLREAEAQLRRAVIAIFARASPYRCPHCKGALPKAIE